MTHDDAPQYKHRIAPVRFKAVSDDAPEGLVEAIVSVFGNVDSSGDVVLPGAFTDTLAAWEAKGDPIPFVWSHLWGDPFAHLGDILKAEEVEEGLYVKAQLDLALYPNGAPVNPMAHQVARLLKARRVTQFSFAYDVVEAAWAERDGREVYELRALDLIEAGPTLLGVNRSTRLLSAKGEGEAHPIAKAEEADSESPVQGATDTTNTRLERALRLASAITEE